MSEIQCDVAIIGAGPAGLSAALLLSRSRRRVVVCDDGKPRNYAAKAVHGFLGMDGVKPSELRKRGQEECRSYDVEFISGTVGDAACTQSGGRTSVCLVLQDGTTISARKVLLATGVKDKLPRIIGFDDFYGTTIHHCPYCDGWEHSGRKLVAYGQGSSAANLAVKLLTWSREVTCCSDNSPFDPSDQARLIKYGIIYHTDKVERFEGLDGKLATIAFSDGKRIKCDALFFSSGLGQRSDIPRMLGCDVDEKGALRKTGKQGSGVRGVFLAGDADDEVQFAIVAAAEGASAATAINSELEGEDFP